MKVKAAVLEGLRDIQIREFPYPADVTEDSMIVKMNLSGICGTDKHIYQGRYFAGQLIPYPIILGHENVGTVHEIGDKTPSEMEATGKKLVEGDRVTIAPGIPCGKCWYCKWLGGIRGNALCENGLVYGLNLSSKDKPHLSGGWSEFIYLRPGTWVFKIPDDMPSEIALLAELFDDGVEKAIGPSVYASRDGLSPSNTIVIQGSGPMGIIAAAKANMFGAGKIIMIGAPEHRLKLAAEFGVDHSINIEEYSEEERIKEVMKITGRGADIVIECTGIPDSINEGISMLRRGGTYLEIGCFMDTGSAQINPHVSFNAKDITLIGHAGGGPQEFGRAITLLERNIDKFPWSKIVTHKFSLNDVQKAMESSIELKPLKAAFKI